MSQRRSPESGKESRRVKEAVGGGPLRFSREEVFYVFVFKQTREASHALFPNKLLQYPNKLLHALWLESGLGI